MNDSFFSHDKVPLSLLKKRAFNYRWAEVDEGVIPLTAADPDFAVAPEIRQVLSDYADSGVYPYGPSLGLPAFKKALSTAFEHRKHYQINPDLILPIDGAASGMYSIARAFLHPGDEVIIFDPVDFLFEQSVLAAQAKVIRCPMDTEKRCYQLGQLSELITDNTKIIAVCNPHNPLGLLLGREELREIAELAQEHELIILNDEIWSDIVYPENPFHSFHHLPPALQKNIISVYGFSKAFGLAGLRVGAVFTNNPTLFEDVVQASFVKTTAGGVSTVAQIAAICALEQCWYWVDAFIAHLRQQRDYAINFLNALPGFRCASPEATYLLFPNITQTGMNSDAFVSHCLHYNVALVPGNAQFFGLNAHGHIRLCFATSHQILHEGLVRIQKAIHHI